MRIVWSVAAAAWLLLTMGAAQAIAPTETASTVRVEQIASEVADLRTADRLRELQQKEQSTKREADDLVAQQSMANSTQDIATLTEVQIWLGFATLVGLLVTVYFGRKTISQSSVAIEENRRFSEMELRCYIGPTDHIVKNAVDGEQPEIKTKLKNFGKTPGFNLRSATCAVWIESVDRDNNIVLPDRFILEPHFSTVMPDGTASVTAFGPCLDRSMIDKLESYSAGIQIAVAVSYTDAFGDDHILKSGMMFFGPNLSFSEVISNFEQQDHIDFPTLNRRSFKVENLLTRIWREVRRTGT